MASPTQTVVGKGISNPLTAEDLLKILRDMFPFDPTPPTAKDRGKCWLLKPNISLRQLIMLRGIAWLAQLKR